MGPALLITLGFVFAVAPTMFLGVWNGQSLLGTVAVAIGFLWMFSREADRV
jgi:hypothetical protein